MAKELSNTILYYKKMIDYEYTIIYSIFEQYNN